MLINRTYGQALETAISLGWLGRRRDHVTSPRFADLLDWVLTVPGFVGAELRSVLAAFRPVLEHYREEEWLDRRHGNLFGGELGEVTFEVTLEYSRTRCDLALRTAGPGSLLPRSPWRAERRRALR